MKLNKYQLKPTAFFFAFATVGSKHCHDQLCVLVHGGVVIESILKEEKTESFLNQLV